MKIAVIIRKLNVSGGAQRIALNTALRLQKMGHEMTLYTFVCDIPQCFPDLLKQFEVIELPPVHRRNTSGFFGFLKENKMARDLAYLIKRDTEILYPDDGPAHHSAYYYKKNIRNIPSVWNMNELPTMRWPLELLSITENRALHDIPWRPFWFKKIMILLKTRYEKKFIQAQNAIIVFDRFHQMMLRRYAHAQSIIIPSGADVYNGEIAERCLPPKKGERLNLLSSGIFLSYRRFEDAIEALALLVSRGYDAHLSILGDYSTDRKYYEKLKELCRNRQVEDRVVCVGRYFDAELAQFFRESHIFVYPHLQSQGIAVNEAIASGLPTIVTPLAGTYETLADGVHALFAPPRDPTALARAIECVVSDPALYEKLRTEGARHMQEHFSWDIQAKSVEKVLQKTLHDEKR